MAKLGNHIVPDFWLKIFPEDFYYFRIPEEAKATCLNCPKIKSDGYVPGIKCCTYFPRIPNFLLGQALKDDGTKDEIRRMISDRFATPEGLQQTPGQAVKSISQNAADNFGKNKEVVCRFLNDGKCGIYLYRNSVCSTFFCQNDQKSGEEFWARVQAVAGQVETALAQWAMDQVGIPGRTFFAKLNSLDVENSYDPKTLAWTEDTLKTMWQDWYGREEEFYLACAAAVDARDDLFQLACTIKLLQPAQYEQRMRAGLSDELKRELDSEGPVSGKPVAIQDLWYQLQRAHSDLAREMAGV